MIRARSHVSRVARRNVKCCLCLKSLDSVSHEKTRKVFYGANCVDERTVLCRVLARKGIQLQSASPELSNINAIICASCCRLLVRIRSAEQELTKSLSLVDSFLALANHGSVSQPQTRNVSAHNQLTQHQETASMEMGQDSNQCLTTSTIDQTETLTMEVDTDSGDADYTSHQSTTSTMASPIVTVNMRYPTYEKNHNISTPCRKRAVSSCTRKSYKSAASHVTELGQDHVLKVVSLKIRAQMCAICSSNFPSVLRNGHDELKNFSWDSLWNEFQVKVPWLVKFLKSILPCADKIFISFVICLLLKKRCQKMSFMQRMISVVLYGNSASKQIYNYLQPLMVCMSPSYTYKIIDAVTKEYNIPVLEWSNALKDIFTEMGEAINIQMDEDLDNLMAMMELNIHDDDDGDADDTGSIIAPSEVSYFSDCEDDTVPAVSVENEVAVEPITQAQGQSLPEVQVRTDEPLSMGVNQRNLDQQVETEMPHLSQHEELTSCPTQARRDEPMLLEAHQRQLDLPAENEMLSVPVPIVLSSASLCPPPQQVYTARNNQKLCGFTIVGDNIDKNFRPSYQRQDRQTKSVHYFHSYAVKNRVDVSALSDARPPAVLSADVILPTQSDVHKLLNDFEILTSRILVQHVPSYKNQVKLVTWHIPSQHSAEMATQSEVVPLGVILKNEANLGEMCHIVGDLSKYVPSNCGYAEEHPNQCQIMQLLLFGDQLTVERARGAMVLRSLHEHAINRLEGFVPVIADWHARMTLVKVVWDRLYSTKSSCDKGTLYQLRNLVHRSSVGADPSKNMKAFEDFLLVVMSGYIVAAADSESSNALNCVEMAKKIVSKWVKVSAYNPPVADNVSRATAPVTSTPPLITTSTATMYTTDVLTLGLLWHGFHDAIREGDGDRIFLYWKFLLPVFKQESHHNYAKEAFKLILQSKIMSPRKLSELKWSRTINTHGKAGHNVPSDLHMEHLNRRLKRCIRSAGSNIYPKAIERVAKSLGPISHVCTQFEKELALTENKDYHTYPSFKKDLDAITQLLIAEKVFTDGNRTYTSYKGKPLFESICWDDVSEWVKEKLINTSMY